YFSYFFFQAEDGIRDFHVTGVQTCALPILNVVVHVPHTTTRGKRPNQLFKRHSLSWGEDALRASRQVDAELARPPHSPRVELFWPADGDDMPIHGAFLNGCTGAGRVDHPTGACHTSHVP